MAGTRMCCVVAGVLALAGAAESRTPPARNSATAAFPSNPPLPPPRPDRPAPADETATDGNGERKPASTAETRGRPEAEACRERLARLGVRFEIRPPLRDGSCGAPEPLLVSGLTENVEVEPAATMTCPVAEALALWTTDVVAVESERHLRTKPVRLLIGTSYECRNQRSGGKMSEHAFANGVDVMGFAFPARPNLAVAAQADGSPEGAFLVAVREGACVHFTTVLGPGSDAAHADHLHLDLRARRGGYRICQ
jgi:hypothetical protein